MVGLRSARLPLIVAVVTFNLALLLATVTWRRVFPEVTLVVAKADVPAGVQLTAEMLTETTAAASARPADAVSLQATVGKWTAIPLLRGEPLTERRLQAAPPPTGDAITSGLLSIPVNGQTALAGRLRPGDRITVMLLPPANRTKPDDKQAVEPKAVILLRDIPVVDVRNSNGQSAVPTDPKGKESSGAGPLGLPSGTGGTLPATILVDVTEQQALQLVDAVESKAVLYLYRHASGGDQP